MGELTMAALVQVSKNKLLAQEISKVLESNRSKLTPSVIGVGVQNV